MFKLGFLSSIFTPSNKSGHPVIDSGDIPKTFSVASRTDPRKHLKISMENTFDEDFVNINMREMSYAEAAHVGLSKPSTSRGTGTGSAATGTRGDVVSARSRTLKRDELDDDGDDLPEKLKSSIHYKKHKQYKKNEKKRKMKTKRRY
ncbi:hypothetical protein PSN45_000048 [Yamadazyma tenuis]|uniref:Uncharacterized protein n=1 Tax=Candida tenuis (strain ATCC 10573 / BCRC 21748 / CBS 615 / JCM 9827 / NBRC 10315 / NRRL Y-1498 / VKM Y-70) TaxID=590646 RepID=G3BA80_CANTC|nr:uncharacterized protein CANTEDRAFT_114857 [Yamadazyma tenuis ATCC 10573]XP_006688672.1 uncharacterized protein CANTEDRAFT_114857 [Yamadazyma tenuis ATCC 10573]EGV62501.1 hypothetical protein CANTEDRAFT_114857 [Yamadazyma tenuis ATCC 10573]EGV62502.1 hypothetical protein CANTEDRAFT_114857 [Yamadazyma tenuis ATCC 10573]WEJ92595.1 hypothetical protein PSN45_000048 [Yamadazyma tenuis]